MKATVVEKEVEIVKPLPEKIIVELSPEELVTVTTAMGNISPHTLLDKAKAQNLSRVKLRDAEFSPFMYRLYEQFRNVAVDL